MVVSNIHQLAVSLHIDSLLVPRYHLHSFMLRFSFLHGEGIFKEEKHPWPFLDCLSGTIIHHGNVFVYHHLAGQGDSTPTVVPVPPPELADGPAPVGH